MSLPLAHGFDSTLLHYVLVPAARALARNKMRSALTMLGIFISVAAVIAMVAVGDGASASVKATLRARAAGRSGIWTPGGVAIARAGPGTGALAHATLTGSS